MKITSNFATPRFGNSAEKNAQNVNFDATQKPKKEKKIKELSKGNQQKIQFITAIINEPKLLILDEPFSALDYQSRLMVTDDVYEIIKKEGKTAIMVTHDLGEAITMSKRVLVLSARPATIKDDVTISFEKDYLAGVYGGIPSLKEFRMKEGK